MAVCVAIIGKDNSPKYISCLNPELELQFHYKVHTSLDVVEEKLTSVGKTTADVRELYLGLLYSTEEHKIFGYVTNTKIKFIIVVESSNTLLRDNEVRTVSHISLIDTEKLIYSAIKRAIPNVAFFRCFGNYTAYILMWCVIHFTYQGMLLHQKISTQQ
ncbi:trafficking protein particle complex subunit 2-like protein isoform X1 [Schistocerca gregaria]|uniref:trafficking protein particle complex subunit 2-like protein isoform X1 n=1 Tax=Schistocerca gregaria TaxID=7010 RepID=UPI00211E16DA|nr:trafficking protein particle complex subunit 2-like protein isoform X1 [Schistocerca gregaria]